MQPKQIFLIDDDPDEADFFKEALNQLSTNLVCNYIDNPVKGIALLQNITPDYIFTDMNMPILNGLEFISAIRKIPKLNNVPVILYSTAVNHELENKGIDAGANACIQKQSNIKLLRQELAKIFEYT